MEEKKKRILLININLKCVWIQKEKGNGVCDEYGWRKKKSILKHLIAFHGEGEFFCCCCRFSSKSMHFFTIFVFGLMFTYFVELVCVCLCLSLTNLMRCCYWQKRKKKLYVNWAEKWFRKSNNKKQNWELCTFWMFPCKRRKYFYLFHTHIFRDSIFFEIIFLLHTYKSIGVHFIL